MFDKHLDDFEPAVIPLYAGTAMAANMAIMAITTSSSMSVKPGWCRRGALGGSIGMLCNLHRLARESKLKVILITAELARLVNVPAGAPRYSLLPASDPEAVTGG